MADNALETAVNAVKYKTMLAAILKSQLSQSLERKGSLCDAICRSVKEMKLLKCY